MKSIWFIMIMVALDTDPHTVYGSYAITQPSFYDKYICRDHIAKRKGSLTRFVVNKYDKDFSNVEVVDIKCMEYPAPQSI